MKTVIVTPTVRPERLPDFWEAWRRPGVDFIFVHDAPEVPAVAGSVPGRHLCWKDADVQPWGWIIPRKTAAIRSLGIWEAWRGEAEAIVCLDDDIYPTTSDHLQRLVDALDRKWQTDWVYPHPQGARGLPYNLGYKPTWLHMGAWDSNADLDAPHRLVLGDTLVNIDTIEDRVVPSGQFLVLSAMHFAFRRELAPAAYHLLMGEGSWGNWWNLHRFDDVWAGMFMKKVCDHLDAVMSYGGPLCEHRQVSNVFNNLVAEAEGMREHEKRWRDIVSLSVSGDCPKCAYESLARGLIPWGGYWERLGRAMGIWANLFPCPADQHGEEMPIRLGVTQFIRTKAHRESAP